VILVLNGTLRGHYHVNLGIPDVGEQFILHGKGRVQGFGHTDVTGQIHSIGFIARGQASGTLSLSSPTGKLTLVLTGPDQHNGPKGPPDRYTFTTDQATGTYTNIAHSGTVSLVLFPSVSKNTSGKPVHGTFTLVLTST